MINSVYILPRRQLPGQPQTQDAHLRTSAFYLALNARGNFAIASRKIPVRLFSSNRGLPRLAGVTRRSGPPAGGVIRSACWPRVLSQNTDYKMV